jgi:hypothetical protein
MHNGVPGERGYQKKVVIENTIKHKTLNPLEICLDNLDPHALLPKIGKNLSYPHMEFQPYGMK